MGIGLDRSQGDQVDMLAEVCEPSVQLLTHAGSKGCAEELSSLQHPNGPGLSENWSLQFTINLKEEHPLKPVIWLAVLE